MLESLLAALIPLGVETSKAVINKFLGQKELTPATFEQGIELAKLDIERLKTITAIDNQGETYKWVEAVRKLQRPIVIATILIIWALSYGLQWEGDIHSLNQLASMVFFYLFGDRSASYIFNKGK